MEFRAALLGVAFFGYYVIVANLANALEFNEEFLPKLLMALILTIITAFVTKKG